MTPLNTPRAKEIALIALAVAQQQAELKLLEDPIGSNRGKLIDAFNKFAGVEIGSPWCAAFACACFGEGCLVSGLVGDGDLAGAIQIATSKPFDGLLNAPEHTKAAYTANATMRLTASSFGLMQMAITQFKNWKPRNTAPLPGWIVLYRFGGGADEPHAVPQHTEIVVRDMGRGTIGTIGGNTRPAHGGPGSESEGVGVFARTRSTADVVGYIATYEEIPCT